MKPLVIAISLAGCLFASAADELSSAIAEEVPKVKKVSVASFNKLKAGFEFKGLSESPGHLAVLEEMRQFYAKLKRFEFMAKGEEFPEKDYIALQQSQSKVKKMASYVVMDAELKAVLDVWNNSANAVTGSKEAKVAEIKVKKIEKETKKVEKAIERAEKKKVQPVDPAIEAKEARLQALKDHYRLIQKQNRAIIRAGYTTPSGYFPSYGGGYYYNNGTYYPRSNYYGNRYYRSNNSGYCPPYRRSGLQIIYNKR